MAENADLAVTASLRSRVEQLADELMAQVYAARAHGTDNPKMSKRRVVRLLRALLTECNPALTCGDGERIHTGDNVDSTYGPEHRGVVIRVSSFRNGEPMYHVRRDSDGFIWIGMRDTVIKRIPPGARQGGGGAR